MTGSVVRVRGQAGASAGAGSGAGDGSGGSRTAGALPGSGSAVSITAAARGSTASSAYWRCGETQGDRVPTTTGAKTSAARAAPCIRVSALERPGPSSAAAR
ncbi:hypothetical protein Sfulv_25460 [Streptomyces fulvorobeus]|uniref:Uncharacterized protein n=1 Tax=Streptomyces fulvorobeus TaxID=284028 RepID=A0A7J0C5B8_9ACTN|nr:hypothetical protein Sfulv_25460 [Streptomyces fulvorobeus]